jgi:hypothetical protein
VIGNVLLVGTYNGQRGTVTIVNFKTLKVRNCQGIETGAIPKTSVEIISHSNASVPAADIDASYPTKNILEQVNYVTEKIHQREEVNRHQIELKRAASNTSIEANGT